MKITSATHAPRVIGWVRSGRPDGAEGGDSPGGEDFRWPWLGLWLLENDRGEAFGCVRLSEPADAAASAELTYLLDPTVWGRGLATRMARTALARAFARGADTVLAGVDAPNTDSIAVLRRSYRH